MNSKSKAPTAATPRVHNKVKDPSPYRTGMGDTFHAPQRPHSDHSHIKSKGIG